MNEQRITSMIFVLINFLQRLSTIVIIPLYTKFFSVEEYGLYTVLDSWLEIIIVIFSLNLFQNILNVAFEKYQDKDAVASAFCGISILATVVGGCLLLIFKSYFLKIYNIDKSIILAFCTYLVFNPIYMIWCNLQRYYYECSKLFIITVLRSIVFIALGICVVNMPINKVLYAVYVKAILEVLFGGYALIAIVKNSNKLFNYEYWRFTFKMSFPLIPYYLSLRVLQHLDRIMIEYIEGAESAAKYSLAYKITNCAMVFNTSINNGFLPWLYNKLRIKQNGGIKSTYFKLAIAIISLNIILSLLSPEIILILGTYEYIEASYLIPPLAMSAVFIFIYDQFVNIELFYEKNKINTLFAVIVTLFNAITNMIFIKQYGYAAAAYTTFISYLLFMILHMCYGIYLKHKYKSFIIFDLKTCVILISVAVASIFLCNKVMNVTMLRYFFCGFFMLICIKNICRKWKS